MSQVVPYEPVPCKSCGAILNPYSRCDFAAKLWICPFCHARNHFPAHYQARSVCSNKYWRQNCLRLQCGPEVNAAQLASFCCNAVTERTLSGLPMTACTIEKG